MEELEFNKGISLFLSFSSIVPCIRVWEQTSFFQFSIISSYKFYSCHTIFYKLCCCISSIKLIIHPQVWRFSHQTRLVDFCVFFYAELDENWMFFIFPCFQASLKLQNLFYQIFHHIFFYRISFFFAFNLIRNSISWLQQVE